MIFGDFSRALSQLGDPRFRRVVMLGVLLALALLFGVYALILIAIQWLDPGSIDLFLIGPVEGLGTLLSLGSLLLILVLSIFLMIPVAAAFTGLFLEDVADAVEDRFYPGQPPVVAKGMASALIEVVNFAGVFLAMNLLLLVALTLGPLYIPVWWAANGYLLGREYFTLVAARRLPREGVVALRRRHRGQIWLAGTLMAMPLSIPILNLVIPVLGVATFTHLYHRLTGGARQGARAGGQFRT